MPQELFKTLTDYLKKNAVVCLILLAVFAAGVIAGWIVPSKISPEDYGEMTQYLSGILQELPQAEIDKQLETKMAFYFNGLLLLLIWFFGLTVIGSPLVLAVLFYKGATLGMTIGFLLGMDDPQGLVTVLLAVMPQNLFFVPLFLAASLLAATFSLRLLRKEYAGNFGREFLRYTFYFLILLLGVGFCSYIQGHAVPWLFKSLFKFL